MITGNTVHLELRNISKTYVDRDSSKRVLGDLSLSFEKGEFSAVLGPSGCGKSTLLKICSSMIKPDSGLVSVLGASVDSPGRDRILMLQDDNQLFPWLTVEGNIMFALKPGSKKGSAPEIKNILEVTGLSSSAGSYPHQLSGGMKKRTALARALIGNPEILLLDEPFSSLDARIKSRLHESLLSIWNEFGLTVVLVTHDISEAITLGRRIIIMNGEGEIVCDEENPFWGERKSEDDFFNVYRKYYKMITGTMLSG